ncbi:MAG: bifunctional alpha,alpha-trehalose-phosphate synthase (UDP-forming)/trehalose-phosphatase [Candidatus Nanopelagicales bacterium]|nr:bifunctional alpha,alpha-trehalose-phosphate synthase (UDP-forming)/trehalose-phosphatase [Candidatus Nanopelagicales bacterium]
MPELIVVANRLPVEPVYLDGDPDQEITGWRLAPGGLVSALESVFRTEEAIWVGAGSELPDVDHGNLHLETVSVDARDMHDYYEGFSNSAIWPLYHDAVVPPVYHRHQFRAYERVNNAFASRVAEIAQPNATVWVHDYQLQLVPSMLREMRPDLSIGFFLHIPFPPSALFAQLPWRRQILEGLLGADLIGFHTHDDARQFVYSCERSLGLAAYEGTMRVNNRRVGVGAFPIGIDAEGFSATAAAPHVLERARQLRAEMGSPTTVLLGVDRLDYTKGIDIRLKAFAEVLQDERLDAATTVFVQVAVPSRENISQYQQIRDDIEMLVGRFNGSLATFGATPIHYLRRVLEREELIALYLATDIMLVTPLRDGMNLVAKEYVACRNDDTGALVLSEFTGAARELAQAWLVNPYDTSGVSEAIVAAAQAPDDERQRRMTAMRSTVFATTAQTWAREFLTALRTGIASAHASVEDDRDQASIPLEQLASSRHLLVCVDYDGTISNIVTDPDAARPVPEAVEALEMLRDVPNTSVAVVSGRALDNLRTVSAMPDGIHLVGSHGAEVDVPLELDPSQRRLLDQCTAAASELVAQVPGAFIETKPGSIAIHVRQCEPKAGANLIRHIVMGPGRYPGVLGRHGKEVIELSVAHAQKADAVRALRQRFDASTVLFVGDDLTDESVFADLSGQDVGIKVGSGESAALWRVESPQNVALLLQRLAQERSTFAV